MAMVNLVKVFSDFSRSEKVGMPVLMALLKDTFTALISKSFGKNVARNFNIINNAERGCFRILWERRITEDEAFFDFYSQIMLSKARSLADDFYINEVFLQELAPTELGAQALRDAQQIFFNRLMELKNHELFNRYNDKIGKLFTVRVEDPKSSEAILVNNANDRMILPKSSRIPGEFFRRGEYIRVILSDINIRDNHPVLQASRIHSGLLPKLLAYEIPEIFHGLVKIDRLGRIPGVCCKVVVSASDPRIDPIGAAVGVKGANVSRIVNELRRESVRFIEYSADKRKLLAQLLLPAKVDEVKINEQQDLAEVFIPADQVSKAIGPNGSNIRLASALSRLRVDVYTDDVPV